MGDRSTSTVGASLDRASIETLKSSRSGRPSALSKILDGLMSRWMIPR